MRDRVLLGVVAGVGANALKLAIGKISQHLGIAEISGPERAAGMLMPAHKLATPLGKTVGYVADVVIAAILGTVTVYALSVTGKDKALFKGAASGQAMWSSLYGMLATLGATRVAPLSARTVLSEFVGHTAYGAMAALIATKLGDPALFEGKIPLIAAPIAALPQQLRPDTAPANRQSSGGK